MATDLLELSIHNNDTKKNRTLLICPVPQTKSQNNGMRRVVAGEEDREEDNFDSGG